MRNGAKIEPSRGQTAGETKALYKISGQGIETLSGDLVFAIPQTHSLCLLLSQFHSLTTDINTWLFPGLSGCF
jgi:hypothetical protein